nr:hypothetical protein [Thioalkalivibrio sp.]
MTANVFAKYLEGQWEYRYTVGFLSEGSYDLKLVFEGDPLDQAKGVSVVAGETTEQNFSGTN